MAGAISLKSRSRTTKRLKLPVKVPGTPEQLLHIAHCVMGQRKGGLPRNKASLPYVIERLSELGQHLLDGLQQQVTSPSAKGLEAQLALIQRHARVLEDALTGLPPFSLESLNGMYSKQSRWNPDTHTIETLDMGTVSAAEAVSAIGAAAERQLRDWQKGAAGGRVPPDQRGPMRAYQRVIGDPRTLVAEHVTALIIAEQGISAASAEESGAVYVSFALLWEWATGLSDEGAHLRKHVRQGVKTALLVEEARILREQAKFLQDSLNGLLNSVGISKYDPQVSQISTAIDGLRASMALLELKLARRPNIRPQR